MSEQRNRSMIIHFNDGSKKLLAFPERSWLLRTPDPLAP